MKVFVLALTLLFVQTPKFNPTGTWELDSGSQYQIRMNGSDLEIKLVQGSNPRFVQYNVMMKNQGEVNSYQGAGSFVAKMENGKECKYEVEWRNAVVSPERIVGVGTNITPDKDTCGIKEKKMSPLEFKKK